MLTHPRSDEGLKKYTAKFERLEDYVRQIHETQAKILALVPDVVFEPLNVPERLEQFADT